MRTHLKTPSTWISLLALVFAMSGGAVAAGLITSKQIKDGSLRVKDFKQSERGKLRGKEGPAGAPGTSGATGAAGARGPSAFEVLPSGETLSGGGLLNAEVSVPGFYTYHYTSLAAELAVPLNELAPGRNVFFRPGTANAAPGSTSASCAGTFIAPTAPAGTLCVYLTSQNNLAAGLLDIRAGTNPSQDGADARGFFVEAVSAGAGRTEVRYVWAYTAP